ncbi:MAG: FAD-binding oxidoreductase [Chloroflexi bacterium]|nr:FAD-binding oxidoreductase [Chloroflexota bacterium]
MGSKNDEFFKEVVKIVGKEFASAEREDIVPYCRDEVSQALKTYDADYVVVPGTAEEVQAIVKLANKTKTPLYPYSYGTNLSGATMPRKGGAVVVLRRLNKILKIDEETQTATIEPGVTWAKLIFETKKVGLEPLPLGGGPHTGGPIGNYNLGGGSTGSIDLNEVVSLEAILPNGELIRTGSAAFRGMEVTNPYFRIAWGPNMNELFRGSMGIYGIVTKMVRRLYPVRAIEEPIQIAFPDVESIVGGMRDVTKLGICKQIVGTNRYQTAAIAATSDVFHNQEEFRKLEDSLPEFLMMAKISCYNEKQAQVYRELINEAITKNKGKIITFEGYVKETLSQLWGGSSVSAIHYLRHEPHLMAFVYVPPHMIPGAMKLAHQLLAKLDYRMHSSSGRDIPPRIWLSPWERTECFMMEFDIEFNPMDKASIEKFRQFMPLYFQETMKYGSAQASAGFFRQMEPGLLPSYSKLLRDIKNAVDPNHIMAPAQVFKDI